MFYVTGQKVVLIEANNGNMVGVRVAGTQRQKRADETCLPGETRVAKFPLRICAKLEQCFHNVDKSHLRNVSSE